ncbi:MAG: DMSO/selenate family reductase complex B subunit [Eggerthellaceae bacterium]|jgi:anaerobic dimethyl sulfoxide reductase subunit B (iron-sulfur subunit)
MTQYGFYFDDTRCTGCRTCTMACKDYHDNPDGVAYRKVYDVEGGTWTERGDGIYTTDCFMYHISLGCQHCSDPACTKACPTQAMHKDLETGIVSVDASKCIGCGYCVMACPYNVPTVDRTVGHSVKCDGCIDRVKQGLNPICVDACPLRALDFGPVTEMANKHLDALSRQLQPMPDPSITMPNTLIKSSEASEKATADNCSVINYKEVE